MKTLIIYDNDGYILLTQSGDYRTPHGGIQYLEWEMPDGKYAESVNVEKKEPVLKDMPKSEVDNLKDTVRQLQSDFSNLMLTVATGGVE